MPQSTRNVPLTRAWSQITDGTTTNTVTVVSGNVSLADSTDEPVVDFTGHAVKQGDLAWVVTPPSVLWARAAGTSAILVVSGD